MPNNAKHTPGEWVVVDASQVAVKLRNHNGEEYTSGIATLYSGSPIPGKSYDEGRAEMEANAALIASAPTLLQWKAEALPLLTAYDDIASEVPGRLGSSKVENLRAEFKRLGEANKAMLTALDAIKTDVLIALNQLRKSLEAPSVEAIDECTKAAIHYLERVKEELK